MLQKKLFRDILIRFLTTEIKLLTIFNPIFKLFNSEDIDHE